jgi:hypothetical protein
MRITLDDSDNSRPETARLDLEMIPTTGEETVAVTSDSMDSHFLPRNNSGQEDFLLSRSRSSSREARPK